MNSKHRHELQQNELAAYLSKVNEALDPHKNVIAAVAGLLLVGGFAWTFYRTQETEKRSDATLRLIQASAANDAEPLQVVSDSYPGTTAADWARLYQGERYLAEGMQTLYRDRQLAEDLLTDAQAVFLSASASTKDRVLKSRAHLGVARAAESMGMVEEAIEAYRDVIAAGESDAMIEKAEARIERLENPKTEQFFAWFQKENFAPADPSLPPSLPGADDLPALPDLKLPELNLSSEGDDSMELKNGGLEMPADDAKEDAKEDAGDDADATDSSDSVETKAESSESAKEAAAEKSEKVETDKETADPKAVADEAVETPESATEAADSGKGDE